MLAVSPWPMAQMPGSGHSAQRRLPRLLLVGGGSGNCLEMNSWHVGLPFQQAGRGIGPMTLHFLTNFADQAVILPLVVVTGMTLLLVGWWRGALAWFFAVPATLGVVLVGKLSTIACQNLLPPIGLFSPSGHTASAAVVYGGVLALLLQRSGRRGGLVVALVCATLVAGVFGFTRVALSVHTMADVVAGGLIGTAGVMALAWLAGPRPALPRAWIGLSATVVLVALLFNGRHVYAEMHISRVSQQIWPLSLCAAEP